METQRVYPSVSRINYASLMQKRIRKVLLICSSYDAYSLEEDGRIDGQINREYFDLNLSNPPSFTRVNTSTEALELLRDHDDFDLVISMLNVGELDVFHFATQLKNERPGIPVVLLTHFTRDLYRRLDAEDRSGIDYIFSWHGNADLILAIIKLIEDRMNADADILGVGVQSILLVEDNEELRAFMHEALADHYAVYEAEDGKKALEMLEEHELDIIISDIVMPGIDGIELCNELELDFIEKMTGLDKETIQKVKEEF